MYELKRDEFGKVNPLFSGVDHGQVAVESILSGINPGRVFVDDKESPESALVYPEGGFYYLASSKPNEGFYAALHQMVFEEWQVDSVELFLHPDDLRCYLNIIFGGRPNKIFQRRKYRLNTRKFGERKECLFQTNFDAELCKVDRELLSKHSIKFINTWSSSDDFLRYGSGYCAISSGTVVSECLVCHRAGHKAEIVVYTDQQYRRQGLATVTAAALIAELVEAGLEPVWSCWDFNQASWQLAEKLGFELAGTKPVFLWDIYTKQE